METVTCTNEHIKELLPAYLAQELAPTDLRAVEKHIEACPDCSAELDLLRIVANEAVPDPEEAFWNTMPDRVYRAVKQEAMDRPHVDLSRLLRGFQPRWVFAAATICVLLVVSLSIFYMVQLEPDTMTSQIDPYADEALSSSMTIAALNQDEIISIDTWAGSELFSIAQEAEPVMAGDQDTNLYEELAVLNGGEIDKLSRMINDWEEEV